MDGPDSSVAYSSFADPAYEYPATSIPSSLAASNSNPSSVNHPNKNKRDDKMIASGKKGRSAIFNAVHLGVAFCLVFLAFSVAQNSQTSDLGSAGNIGLGILYGVFTLCNLISSWLINVIGINVSLFLGALSYALYVACNVHIINPLLYASSAVVGFGASIIWTAQGSYISYCATSHETTLGLPPSSTVGLFNGIFFSIFQVNQFAGNLIAALLYQFDVSSQTVFIVMTVFCTIGSICLFFIERPISLKVKEEEDERTPMVKPSISQSTLNVYSDDSEQVITSTRVERPSLSKILESLKLFSDPRMLFSICIIIYSGLSQAFIYGAFTNLIAERNYRFYAMSCFGGVDALTSVALGKLSDKVGRVPILAVGFVAHAATFIYYIFFYHEDNYPTWAYFLLASGLGVGDAVFNTQVYAILGTFFETKADQAFANYKLFQSGSTTVSFVYSIYYPAKYTFFQALVPGGFLILGCASLLICHLFYHPLDSHEDKTGMSIENLATVNADVEDFQNPDSEDVNTTTISVHRRRGE